MDSKSAERKIRRLEAEIASLEENVRFLNKENSQLKKTNEELLDEIRKDFDENPRNWLSQH